MQKRDLLILLLAFVMAAGIAVGVFVTDGMETGSWGLSFRQEGAPPTGNQGPAETLPCGLSGKPRKKSAVSDLRCRL